jgi:hypothetical protein
MNVMMEKIDQVKWFHAFDLGDYIFVRVTAENSVVCTRQASRWNKGDTFRS